MGRNFLVWLGIAAVMLVMFSNFNSTQNLRQLSYSQFVESVRSGEVDNIVIDGLVITGVMANGEAFETVRPALQDPSLMDELINQQVKIEGARPEQQQSAWMQLLIASLPILIILALFFFLTRQIQGGGGRGGPLSFGKSKARLMSEDQVKTTFADVAGADEAKEEVEELVTFLRDPGKFQRLGGRMPSGILMVGSPGTGKTLLAKAIAGEAKVPFFSISGSDFVEMFVGVGASRVRDMFEQAKKQAPCIIFIDEIDAVGRHRGAGLGGGHDEREQTLNQLLVEMDGFEVNEGIIVIAATNRPDVLDPALLRPGRFDRQVVVPLPDIRGREQILKIHMRKVPASKDVKASILARATPGFTGADLANLVNEAALFAARSAAKLVRMEEFEKAKDKIMMGAERRSMVMSEKEKRTTAYHEAGHTIVGRLTPDHDPVYKVTVIPRGRALGVTQFLPEEDRHSHSRQHLTSMIASLFGGRLAEEILLGSEGVTTGASNDIERATALARNMVTRWGLSKSLGPLKYGEDDTEPFLGKSASASPKSVSDETAKKIDAEIRTIIDECYQTARSLLEENIDKLHAMAEALIEYETLNADQIDDIMSGIKPIDSANFNNEPVDVSEPDSDNAPDSDNTDVKTDDSPKDDKDNSFDEPAGEGAGN